MAGDAPAAVYSAPLPSQSAATAREAPTEASDAKSELVQVPAYFIALLYAHRADFHRHLEEQSGASISIDSQPGASSRAGEQRSLCLRGNADAIADAKAAILAECALPHDIYAVPGNRMGAVIGKGGEVIKAIQDRTACRCFTVAQAAGGEEAGGGTERPIHLIGSAEAIAAARAAISAAVFQTQPGDVVVTLAIPDAAAATFIGRRAENVRQLQQATGTAIFLDNAIGSAQRMAYISGRAAAVEAACCAIVEQLGPENVLNVTEQQAAVAESDRLSASFSVLQPPPPPQQQQAAAPAVLTADQAAYYVQYYQQLAASQPPEYAAYYQAIIDQLLVQQQAN